VGLVAELPTVSPIRCHTALVDRLQGPRGPTTGQLTGPTDQPGGAIDQLTGAVDRLVALDAVRALRPREGQWPSIASCPGWR